MSTIKTDTITALSTNGDLSLDGAGTGGVSIASTLKMAKGGDISSASPLVIDTDGNYFDVTGTTENHPLCPHHAPPMSGRGSLEDRDVGADTGGQCEAGYPSRGAQFIVTVPAGILEQPGKA